MAITLKTAVNEKTFSFQFALKLKMLQRSLERIVVNSARKHNHVPSYYSQTDRKTPSILN